jgi:hypothetical protein
MHCRPGAPAAHALARWAAVWLAFGYAAACTDPIFDSVDASDSVEGTDAAADENKRDAPETGADACASCSVDAAAADSDGAVLPALDADTAPTDAQAPLPEAAALDPVRSRWAGRYATRSYVFAYSPAYFLETFGKYLTLAQVKPSADGGLMIEEEICRFESSFNVGLSAYFSVDYPTGTALSAPLSFDADRFSSMAASAHVGYGPTPADCAGAMTSRIAGAPRPWLTDNVCDCPRDPAAMPISAKDCRVLDSDADGFAGATFRTTFASSVGVARVTEEQRLRLLNGYQTADRLYAQREFIERTNTLSCTLDGRVARVEECRLGIDGPCPPAFNPVELVRIEASYSCREIIDREQGLFTSPRPAFPAGCQAQVAQKP